MYCKRCGAQIDDDSNFCWKCGQDVRRNADSATMCCKHCGAKIDGDSTYCCECGQYAAHGEDVGSIYCKHCGVKIESDCSYCYACGKAVVPRGSVPTMYCKHCGVEIDKDSTFCFKCGKNVKRQAGTPMLYCKHCGLLIDEDSVFCNKCGGKKKKKIIEYIHFDERKVTYIPANKVNHTVPPQPTQTPRETQARQPEQDTPKKRPEPQTNAKVSGTKASQSDTLTTAKTPIAEQPTATRKPTHQDGKPKPEQQKLQAPKQEQTYELHYHTYAEQKQQRPEANEWNFASLLVGGICVFIAILALLMA